MVTKHNLGCSSESLNLTPKGDQSGRGPTVFTPKSDHFKL